jgi:hypothetical protein
MAYHYTKPQADGSHKWGIRNDLTCAMFKPFYDYLFDNANEIFESYLSNNVVPQGQTQLGLPLLGDVQPTLSTEKIRLPLEKYGVQLSFERGHLIFTSQRQGSIGHVAKC